MSKENNSLWNGLTPREIEIARIVAQGKRNIEIAHELNLSRYTVETHLKNIYHKLEISSRLELAKVVHESSLQVP